MCSAGEHEEEVYDVVVSRSSTTSTAPAVYV